MSGPIFDVEMVADDLLVPKHPRLIYAFVMVSADLLMRKRIIILQVFFLRVLLTTTGSFHLVLPLFLRMSI